jgi:UDP-N-acetylmuramoyl-L-alanyl-D-glutamate--2,6-diaminopimelate ligase
VEVSSHSLVLDRVAGCAFDAAVLTNITQDHLDFHISQDEYCKAKARLFEMLDDISSGSSMDKVAIFNMDDPASRKILETRQSKGSVRASTFTYGLEYEADVTARDIQDQGNGLEFTVITPWGTFPASSPLMGRPNIYNILAAICMTMAFGMGIQDIREGLELMRGVPGRFENIRLGQDFDVVIDYAHTDDALSNLLSVLRRHTHGRIICVFGCGGDRDRGKRPLMGKAAAMGSDWSIITSDNPRSEDPEKIIHEIEEGFLEKGSKGEYEICVDRKDAIYRAVDMARSGDMVVIAGKGHEKVQIVGSEEFPFDDQEVAKQAIQAVMAEKLGK